MFASSRTAALSAVIGLGAIAAIPAAAQADGLYLDFGGSRPRRRRGLSRRPRWRPPRRKIRYDRRYRACTPHRAVDKAERMGIRRARVVDVDRRTIEVAGHERRSPRPPDLRPRPGHSR